jgi:hypothetical protein
MQAARRQSEMLGGYTDARLRNGAAIGEWKGRFDCKCEFHTKNCPLALALNRGSAPSAEDPVS